MARSRGRTGLLALALAAAAVLGSPVGVVRSQGMGGTWQAGPGATGPSAVVGLVEVPAIATRVTAGESFDISGWVVDTTAEGWAGVDEVRVYDGLMEGGGTLLARGVVALDRPDVAARLGNPSWSASGFRATVPTPGVGPGTTPLLVYVRTPDRGWWFIPLSVNAVRRAEPREARWRPGVLALGSVLVAQTALGPIIATVWPRLQKRYLASWGTLTLLQAILALAGVGAIALFGRMR